MNERIKELARQAGLIAPYGSDREGLSDFDYREFAELIVRECANVAADHDALDIYEEIREHFGVGE
jgi:hypothetical protein